MQTNVKTYNNNTLVLCDFWMIVGFYSFQINLFVVMYRFTVSSSFFVVLSIVFHVLSIIFTSFAIVCSLSNDGMHKNPICVSDRNACVSKCVLPVISRDTCASVPTTWYIPVFPNMDGIKSAFFRSTRA